MKKVKIETDKNLTDRELEVIRLHMDGSTTEEVAQKLGITPRTVTTHKYNSFTKIGARNIIEAINYVNTYHKGE